ncbi:hypothetical protein PFZ55_56010, partial [Streptomyces sp. MS2A]|nr:hypothetical protein [Streptomyces sp. MS2A]
ELPVGLGDLHLADPDREALKTLYTRLEFKNWLAELLQGRDEGVDDVGAENAGRSEVVEEVTLTKPARHDQTLLTQEEFDAWLARLEAADGFCFDL